jgi:hypothetical protein
VSKSERPTEKIPAKRTLDEVRAEVEQIFRQAVDLAEATEPRKLVEVERELWTLLLCLGRALVSLFFWHAAARPRPSQYEVEGRRYVITPGRAGTRRSWVGTRFGKVPFTRAVGRPVGKRSGAADRIVDRELGLCGGFSLGVVLGITKLCAQMAFASARSTYKDIHEWTPSSRAVLRMVDAVGERARGFLEAAPAPQGDGEILVIQVDARGAPMIAPEECERRRRRRKTVEGPRRIARRVRRKSSPKERRKSGKKSKNAKMAVVGVIYTLSKTSAGLEGPINKRIYGTFKSHAALFGWLRKEADKRGYGKKRTLFLADGSEHIWRLQKTHFPEAETCLDWYHVAEKLWVAGQCLFAENSGDLKDWVSQQLARLRSNKIPELMKELRTVHSEIPKSGPGNKGRRKRLTKVIRHLEEHRTRMPYKSFRDEDLDIGTGSVEGAVRNLIAIRLDGPGMRWGLQRAELILHLRCIHLNGQWAAFASALASGGDLQLRSQPIPAEPHRAKKKQRKKKKAA